MPAKKGAPRYHERMPVGSNGPGRAPRKGDRRASVGFVPAPRLPQSRSPHQLSLDPPPPPSPPPPEKSDPEELEESEDDEEAEDEDEDESQDEEE
jgi:hypothetical protein